LVFTGKRTSSMKQANLRDILKNASSACTSPNVVSHDLLSPTPSTSLAMKTPQNTEEDTVVPEPEGERDILMEYFSV
jgi:hypothetical protein